MKKPSKEYNLEKLYPELMDEWDYSKNNRPPSDYTPHSGQYVWWICPKSELHNYKTIIDNRTGKKSGCPYCDGKKVCEDNNLQFVFPEISKELHPTKNGNLNPSKIHYGSSKSVWWKCSRNHSFKSQIHSRVKGNWGCPKCSGTTSKMELRLVSELEKIIGKVEHRKKIEGIEIDVYLPYYKIGIEYDGWYWHRNSIDKDKQKNKNLKKMGILLVRIREESVDGQLPKISRKDVLHKKTDKEIDVIKKLLITLTKTIEFSNYRKKIINRYLKNDEFWNDENYFEHLDELKNIPIEKSLQKTHSELLKFWHPTKNGNLKPTNLTINSEIEVWWNCERGKKHPHLLKPRSKKRNGCSICKIKPIPYEKSLEYNEPELSKLFDEEKNGLKPSDVPKGTDKKFWWKCPKGKDHKWEFPLSDIKRKKTYCPFCSGHKVSITNCLYTLYPEVSKEWHPTKNGKTTPKDVYVGSSKKFWFLCSEGHEWKTMIWTRTRYKSNCPRCVAKFNANKRYKDKD
jgi:very-short-patch-repair endonuclease